MSDLDPSGGAGDPGAQDPGAPAPAAPAPVAPSPPYPNPSVPPASPDGGKPADPNFAGISPDDLILNPNDGHLYGFKRTIEVAADGKTVYGYQSLDLGDASSSTALAGIAFNTGIPIGALYMKMQQLRAQNAQTQQAGYGKIIGYDPSTGQFTYQKPDGTRATTSNIADLGGVGIAPNEIHEAQAQAGTTQRTLTQMGQYTVAGMMPDGSLQVRDYNGNLSTFTAAQAQAGQIPGVSYSDFQRAQSEFATNQRTLTQSKQFTLDSAQFDAQGNLVFNVKNFNGQVTPYTGAQLQQALASNQLPGVSLSDVQQAQYKAQDMAWQLSPVNTLAQNSAPYFGNGYGNAPTTPPATPNPTPPPQGGGTPGANPSPTPPYRATPATPGANPNPTPYASTAATPGDQSGALLGTTPGPQMAGGGKFSSAQGSPSTTPALSSAQQASYNAYTQTSAAPGGTSSGYASTPSTPGVVTHQQQQQNNQAYQQNLTQTTATNAGQSRNMGGLGFAGIQPPRVAGYG